MTMRTGMNRARYRIAFGIGLLALTGCGDLIVDGRTLELEGRGGVEGLVYLDANGNGELGSEDPELPGVRVRLLTAAGNAVVDTVTSDSDGRFAFPLAEVGEYRIGLDPSFLADSLVMASLDDGIFLVEPGRTFTSFLGVAFRVYPPAEVRFLPAGVRLITRGIVLNVRSTPGDGVVHIREGNAYLRVTQVPPTGLSVGDTVRVHGRTARSAGQPILQAIPNTPAIINLGPSDELIFPVPVTTQGAAQANGGTLDAALVRVEDAVIGSAVLDANGQHLIVTVNDGSGPLEVVLRNFLNFNVGAIVPGTTQFSVATGLLVPIQDGFGVVRWQLTPRGGGDLDLDPVGGG